MFPETDIDILELQAMFGNFFKDQGQGLKDIYSQIYAPTMTESLFMKIPTVNTVIDKVHHMMREVLQAYQPVFVDKGDQEFTPERIILENLMIDHALTPSDMQQSYLGFMTNQTNDPMSGSIVAYTLMKLVQQAKEDYEKALFYAKKTAIVPGVKKATKDSFDGINTKFKEYKAAGSLIPMASLGALPAPNSVNADLLTCEYIENMAFSIDEEYRSLIETFQCSETTAKLYKRGRRRKYNAYHAQVNDNQKLLGDSAPVEIIDCSIQLQGLRSHKGTTAVWGTVKDNAVMGQKNIGNEGSFKTSVVGNKQIIISSNWWKGVGFIQPAWIFHNGADLV